MHSLTELKDFFQSQGVEIRSFNGMFMETQHGRWGMACDEYRLNGQVISRKEIKTLIFRENLKQCVK